MNVSGQALVNFYRSRYRDFYNAVDNVTPEFIAASHDRLFASRRYSWITQRIERLSRVVEVGSGTGCFLRELMDHGVQDFVGIEPGEAFGRYAREKVGEHRLFLGTYRDGALSIPFRPSLIVSFHVFEHLEDPAGFLRWCHDTLAPDGCIVLELPILDEEGYWIRNGVAEFHIAHRIYPTKRQVSQMLGAAGFQILAMDRCFEEGICANNLRVFAKKAMTSQRLESEPAEEGRIIAGFKAIKGRMGIRLVAHRVRRALSRSRVV